MKNYKVQMMTKNDYCTYLGGGFNYYVEEVVIEAENKENALKIAKATYPNYVINEDCIKTVEEIEEEERINREKWDKIYKGQEEKKALAKARKEEREKAKAEELGLTIEEYKAKVKHDKKVRDTEKRIAELKMELAKEEKYLKKLLKNA